MEQENYWVDGSHRNVNVSYDNGNSNSLSKPILSDTMKSNLKTAKNKIAQFERYIKLATCFLMLFSIVTIFYAFILIRWYFMPNLYFWDATFYIAPYNMLGMGLFTLLVSLFGMVINGCEKRRWFVIYSILLVIAFTGQLASIYFIWNIKTLVDLGSVGGSDVQNSLSDPNTKKSWDEMQSRLMCCGGNNWNTGYTDYRGAPIGQENSVPDSCCINPYEGCGNGILKVGKQKIQEKIFVHGCVEVLKRWLETEVVTLIPVYAAMSLAVALVEIVTVVLSSAYVAQITRRRIGDEIL